MHRPTGDQRSTETDTWRLAIVFGLASIPWTYAFVAGLNIPLWPSFIASATFYAAGEGLAGLTQGYGTNMAGIVYAALTLGIVETFFGGGVIALSVVVGGFMCIATLHGLLPVLSFAPGAFLGYATMFSVHAVEATAFGVPGLPGETVAAVLSMLIGALIGVAADDLSTATSG